MSSFLIVIVPALAACDWVTVHPDQELEARARRVEELDRVLRSERHATAPQSEIPA